MGAVAASAVAASAGPVAGGLLAASDWRRGQSPAVLLAWPAGLRLLPRTGPVPTGPVPTGPVPTGPVRTGPVRTGPVRTGPVRTGPVRTGPVRTGPVRTGPVRTGPVRTGPVRTGPVPTGPVPTGPVYGERRRLDPLGTLLVTGCLTTACVEAADRGCGAPATLGFLAVDLVMGASAVAHVRRHPDPVVDPALFRTRAFTAATLGLRSYFLTYAAPILAATPLFTGAWGRSSARAGLAVTPWPLTVLVVSMLSGRIVRAPGERTTAVVGGLCFAAGPVWWLLPAGGDGAHYAVGFIPGLVLTGVGVGLYQPVMFSAAGLLPARQLSLGSGVLMMSRQGGSALGVAALVVITGGAARPGLDALRAGWVFTAVTAALAAVAGAAVRTGVRADPGESGGSGTDPLRHH
ncbi:MFS transporter [Streptomyces antimycoticus]|uniref:MFS transporter n=1 Tax=Streptomyces antimycoticus TaxID=68175 RepID=UPI0025711B85|nr:MFS transporter [Streptomyces antimycoticus]WJD96706.1 MFS transporter [Streptomyces antimycoticus]